MFALRLDLVTAETLEMAVQLKETFALNAGEKPAQTGIGARLIFFQCSQVPIDQSDETFNEGAVDAAHHARSLVEITTQALLHSLMQLRQYVREPLVGFRLLPGYGP